MSTVSLRKSLAESLSDIFQKWVDEHPGERIEHEVVAKYAIDNGLWKPQPRRLVKELARHLAKVAKSKHVTNAQGVSVRKYQAAWVDVEIAGVKKQKMLWADRLTMSADHAHLSFSQQWDQIAGQCKSLHDAQADFNDNNPHSVKHPSQLMFDFTMVVEAPQTQRVEKIAADVDADPNENPKRPKPR